MNSVSEPSLSPLSPDAAAGLAIAPLGGLGEVGMNCMLYEYDDRIIVVDCGVNFPDEEDYGVDLIVPSFAYLQAHAARVAGIVITHGHEDHIGALPFLLRELNPPIYAGPLSAALIKRKLVEHGLWQHAKIIEVGVGDEVEVGPFAIELIHVNHSIPQTTSLAIRTPLGTVIHTGDFKVEYDAEDEDPIDLARFAALGEEGVLCMLGDSTNVEVPGTTTSEAFVAKGLAEVVERAPGRVIVTLFASNLRRVQSLIDIAHRTGRRVVLLGRSLLNNVEAGRELGLVHLPHDGIIIPPEEVDAFRHDQVLVLCTGSQGEPRSALTRIAMGDHHQFHVDPSDLVIFSSRVIPGNEKAVSRVINHLYRRGAQVYDGDPRRVHASGHACREELKLLLSLVRPEYFVPVHGEYRHLAKHARLAEDLGVEESFLLLNGDVLRFTEEEAEIRGRIPAGRVLIDGKGTDDLPSSVLQDRRKLARTGIVVAWLVLDATSGEVVSGPRLLSQGVFGLTDAQHIEAEASRSTLDAIAAMSTESRLEASEVAEAMRRAVRRCFNRYLDAKPVVVPIVHEL